MKYNTPTLPREASDGWSEAQRNGFGNDLLPPAEAGNLTPGSERYFGESQDDLLTRYRITKQIDYVNSLRQYTSGNTSEDAQRMLYLTNGGTEDYLEELTSVNSLTNHSGIGYGLSIIIPAYNEAGKIRHTIDGWIGQRDPYTGKRLDPSAFSLIIFVNRPNAGRAY